MPGVRWLTRSLAGLSLLGMLGMAGPAQAAPPQPSSQPSEIVGGVPTEICEWPQVAALTLGGTCTATLIHPRMLVYAGHCGTLHNQARLGEGTDSPARELELLRCERASDVFAVTSMDFAFCELREPVEDLPIVPLLFGCDEAQIEVGTPVTIVGFGLDGDGTIGTKRVAESSIVSVLSLIGIGGMGTGADEGDSGGPALVLLDDGSWRVLGIVSGGGGGGAVVQYVPAPVTVEWIEAHSGIDVTPCHAADGSWAPTPACAGFYVAPELGASWADACPSVVSGASARCGPAFGGQPLDVLAPEVAIVDPLDAALLEAAPIDLAVTVEASDAGWGVREVRLELDGEPWLDLWQRQARDEVPPYTFANMEIPGDGEHAIVAIAEDWAGNVRASAALHVQVGELADTTDDGDSTDSSGSTDATDSTDSTDEDPRGGCSCHARADDRGWALTLPIVLLGLGLRRRRISRPRCRPRPSAR